MPISRVSWTFIRDEESISKSLLQTPRFGVPRLMAYFTCFVLAWRCWRWQSPNISGKISFFYIMKSFSRPLVLSSPSVNSNYILTSPLRIVTDFNPTDCDRYLPTSQPLISPTPLLCNDRNREALSVIIHKADWSPDLHMTLTLGRFVTITWLKSINSKHQLDRRTRDLYWRNNKDRC